MQLRGVKFDCLTYLRSDERLHQHFLSYFGGVNASVHIISCHKTANVAPVLYLSCFDQIRSESEAILWDVRKKKMLIWSVAILENTFSVAEDGGTGRISFFFCGKWCHPSVLFISVDEIEDLFPRGSTQPCCFLFVFQPAKFFACSSDNNVLCITTFGGGKRWFIWHASIPVSLLSALTCQKSNNSHL